MKVKFIKKPEDVQDSYSIVIIHDKSVEFDEEAIGEVLYQGQSFGQLIPPGALLSLDYIQKDIDENFGSFLFSEIVNKYDIKRFLDTLQDVNYFFEYDAKKRILNEININKLESSLKDKQLVNSYQLNLIEYEIDGEDEEEEEDNDE